MANLPDPVTRKEQYLSVMAENTAQYPEEPITREEMYLDYLCKNGTGGGSGGTTNYNQLTNRPQINGNTLEGNLTAEDLGLQPENLVVTLTQNGESITADKSYADINQAYTDGKDIYAVIEGNIVPLYGKAGTTYIFQSVLGVQVTDFELNSENEWSVETINIIANSTRPGGIIADEKTDDDTVEVHVDSKTGKAYVNASQDTTTTPPIINTASGNPITLTDSSDNLFQGFEMDGKTEQVTTTGAQLFDASGKEVNSSTLIPFPVAVTDGKYTLSTNANKSSSGNSFVFFSGGNVTSGGDGVYEGKSVTVDSVDGYVTILMRKIEGIDPIKNFETMLNAGTTAKPYEPYTGGAPSPSPDYPQEIVSAGNWNEETQKWEYVIEVGGNVGSYQTVTLTADRPLTKWDRLEKRGGQWGWVYKSEEIESYTDESVPGEYFSTTGQLSVGAQVWYETTEEIFVPLSESEQEAMNALYTYRPTTVISNQQGLDMTVDYIADTKTYIDNKFEALQQSLANTNAQLLGGN